MSEDEHDPLSVLSIPSHAQDPRWPARILGEDLRWFAISDIVENDDAFGAPPTPLRAN